MVSANENQLRYDGRVVVVTGAGAGLGREYALLFGSRGAKVVVNDLGGNFHGQGKSNAADNVVQEIRAAGGTAVPDYNSVVDGDKIIQTAMEAFGRVDVLINNAGILRDKSLARISDEDWNLIHDVHLKGSFLTTRAAWAIMKKQNYGRIIMTSSNSGVYGNFGQANYSAAKLGLVGLANTVAIEGAKNNIQCNVIVPTAASRMTEGILPEILFNELKPKLIAPVVAYLCHESCQDTGAIIESAAGWATKVHFVRGKGSILRTSIDDDVTPEYVKSVWDKVTDMSDAKHLNAISEASLSLVDVLEKLREGKHAENSVTETFKFNFKDVILYALGVGATVTDESDLRFLYENHSEFSVIPTFFILPGLLSVMGSNITASAIPHASFDLTNILHGEQYIELFDSVPTDGNLITTTSVIDVLDKKSGALVITQSDSYDENGTLIARGQSSTFVVGVGNFNGKTKASPEVKPLVPNPKRSPDASVQVKTTRDQAALYRLSGDLNPLHIDPGFSAIAGYKTPILHGLCTMGISVKAVLKQFGADDSSLFKAAKVRFSKPVLPGQTLRVDMWKESNNRVCFRTVVVETNTEVLSGAYVDFKKIVVKPNMTAGKDLLSDAIFAGIKERIAENEAKAKTINAVFLYKITDAGKVVKEWVLDLKTAKVYEGPVQGKADTTMTISDADFVDLALGKLQPQAAFMKGKLKITGNIMLAQKLAPLLKTEAKL
ncbi:peroxisomal multifunctional enzyme type 2-like isoform X1 [Topomyia yanbarensis]|uniref:peroxisomal multifunctional enzyme type 2-like isoform X1 n=2 Tax=Topomyia yanbarensis TaxID=2498891 RepID=UPI00273C433F|nr:peroxisomal multifunctional enzyme type 2-like isoform X1 [Topomyia yanbarensis]XP_058820150.1 peroxisomal multifunctional enzyme type 2-like isoform X1 [Topomyia yanbarensis]